MKSVLAFLLCVLAVSSANVIQQQQIFAEGPACPIAEEITFEESNITANLPPFIVIDEGSTQGGGVATGLNTLFYSYNVNILTLRVDLELTLTSACVRGDEYSATGVIDATPFRPETIPSGPFTGDGPFDGCVTGFRVQGFGFLLVNLITNRLSIRALTIQQLTFTNLSLTLSNLVVGGVAVDWPTWNRDIKANFDRDWAEFGTEIVDVIRRSVNTELAKYTLADLIDAINQPPSTCPPPPSFN